MARIEVLYDIAPQKTSIYCCVLETVCSLPEVGRCSDTKSEKF